MYSAPAEPITSIPEVDPGSVPATQSGHGHSAGRRPALDGLRALAVVAVAVYHFGGGSTSWLPGGFLGVDMFFVLSGYLITGLLLTEYARSGRIDLLGFWVRRLRRLAPALMLMLLVVAGWIWWATPPDDYPMRRADLLWTLGYLANWHLIHTSETYFAAYTTASPLRHAWSLAVEEQFYLVWPTVLLVFLAVAGRLPGVAWSRADLPAIGRFAARFAMLSADGRRRLMVAAVALIGIALSAGWLASSWTAFYPSHAYFGTQGRVQELFVGVLLACGLPGLRRVVGAGQVISAGPVVERVFPVAVAVGLAGLLAALLLLPDNCEFFYRGGALLVCLAVAAVIAGLEVRPDGVLARVFSWRPAVALGRISYGVYLWHWPVVVAIAVNGSMDQHEQVLRQLARALITLAAAIGSYFLLERPVLNSRRVLGSPSRVIVAAAAASALVVGVTLQATALPGTLADQYRHSSDTACPGEGTGRLLTCTWPLGADVASRPVGLALLGDSTGRALGPGLNDWAARTGSTWLDAAWKLCTASGKLIVNGDVPPDFAANTCHQQALGLIETALDRYHPPVVLDAEYWAHSRPVVLDGRRLEAGTPEHDAALRAGYLALVDKVAAYGGRVVFLELAPPGDQLGTAVANGRPAGRSRPPVYGDGRYVDGFNAVLRSVAAARPTAASTVSVTDLVCPGGDCPPVQGDLLVRYDGVHFTIGFSRYLVPILLQRIGLTP